MRTLAVGLALASIVSMMSGCVGGGGSLSVAAPVWESGYSFSYTEQGTYSGATSAEGHTETQEDDYGPYTRVIEVLNTTLSADDEPVYLTAFTLNDESEDDEAPEAPSAQDDGEGYQSMQAGTVGFGGSDVMFMGFRQRDLQEVAAWLEIDADCTQAGCTPRVSGLEFADPPEWTLLDFPLTRGKTWSQERIDFQGGDEFFGDMDIRFEARVVGVKNVDTPLGNLKAVRVDWTVKPMDLDQYEKEVREQADDEDVNLKKFNIELERSGSAFYSEEYMAIVKSTWRGEFLLEVEAEEQGQDYQFSASGRDAGETVLEGVRLVPRAERGLDYLVRLYLGTADLNDPTGLAPEQIQYSLKVLADKTVVNAAEGETVSFTAVPEGVPELPAGHKIAWHVLDGYGAPIDHGTGLKFSYTFTEPGQYSIVADAYDESDKLMTQTGTPVVANYLKSFPVSCPTVVVGVAASSTGYCEPVEVPVRAGVQYARVSAEVSSPLGDAPVVNQAMLVFTDPDGNEQNDPIRENGEYAIETVMFWEFAVTDADWTLQLVHQRGVMEQATYTVDLRYDAVPAMDIEMPFGSGIADALEAFVRGH